MKNSSQEPPSFSKAPNLDLKYMDVLCIFKTKTHDHIQIKIKMPNPCQDPSVFFKVPNQDLKDMDVLCKSRQKAQIQIISVPKTSDYIQMKMKMPNLSQELSASSKAPYQV